MSKPSLLTALPNLRGQLFFLSAIRKGQPWRNESFLDSLEPYCLTGHMMEIPQTIPTNKTGKLLESPYQHFITDGSNLEILLNKIPELFQILLQNLICGKHFIKFPNNTLTDEG